MGEDYRLIVADKQDNLAMVGLVEGSLQSGGEERFDDLDPPPGRHMRWFQAFLNELANDRHYKQTFDHSLTVMFDGFPGELLPELKRDVDLDSMMRSLEVDGNTARESAVYAATNLISALIARLSDSEKQAAIEALERHDDPNNPVYNGFHYMLQVVQQLGVKPALLSRLSYEMVGQLRGMSRPAIQAWWLEAEVPKLVDEIVKREASAQKIAERFAPTRRRNG